MAHLHRRKFSYRAHLAQAAIRAVGRGIGHWTAAVTSTGYLVDVQGVLGYVRRADAARAMAVARSLPVVAASLSLVGGRPPSLDTVAPSSVAGR